MPDIWNRFLQAPLPEKRCAGPAGATNAKASRPDRLRLVAATMPVEPGRGGRPFGVPAVGKKHAIGGVDSIFEAERKAVGSFLTLGKK